MARLDIGVTLHLLGVDKEAYDTGKIADLIHDALTAAGVAKAVIVEDYDEMEND